MPKRSSSLERARNQEVTLEILPINAFQSFRCFNHDYPALGARYCVHVEYEIHLIRKKMKFIRYSLEFFKDFCNKKVYPNFYKTITTTIDNFGLFNDICVTIDRFEGSAQTDPNLLFALSWLKFKRKRVRNLCEKSLKKLMHTPIPWES